MRMKLKTGGIKGAWDVVWAMLLVALLMGGCAGKQVLSGSSMPPVKGGVEPSMEKKTQAPESPLAATDDSVASLMQRGSRLAGVGNYRAALDLYGVALPRASGGDREALLDKVESALLQCDVPVLREIMAVPDHPLPPSMVRYALGYRYAALGEKERSREILQSYLQDYPHGRRAEDARQLVEILTVKKEAEGIKIGCLLPLSGKYAVFGQRALKGIQVALVRLIPRYGDQIHLIIRDTASDDGVALQGMQELITARVMAVVGPMVTAQSVAGVAQAHGIPMVAMTQREEVARSGGYVFTNFITPAMQVQSLVSHAMMHLGVRQFAVLYPRDKYGMTFMKLFCDKVEEMGGEVRKAVAYDGGQTDFSKEIKQVAGFDNPRLQAALQQAHLHDAGRGDNTGVSPKPIVNFEALFIPDAPSRLTLILPQLIYNDVMDIKLLGTNIWHDPSLIRQAGKYVRSAVITEGYFPESHRPEARQFKDAFVKMFGASPGFIEAIAHDTVSILVETAMDPSVTSSETLREALTGTRIFEGATGTTLFDKEGQLHKELFFLTVENGVFVELTR